jgi:hypothetical protein
VKIRYRIISLILQVFWLFEWGCRPAAGKNFFSYSGWFGWNKSVIRNIYSDECHTVYFVYMMCQTTLYDKFSRQINVETNCNYFI